MSFINKSKKEIVYTDNVFLSFNLANQAREKYGVKKVIDATVGTLYDENKKIVSFNTVFNCFNKDVADEVKASYTPQLDGGNDFAEITKKILFLNYDFLYESKVVGTSGGTGALFLGLNTLLDSDDCIIMPTLKWEPIKLMAQENNLKVYEFELFNNKNEFDVTNLINTVNYAVNKHKKICIYLNDPLHNPTSHSMTYYEWKKLIDCLNELSRNKKIVVINDVAYIEYAKDVQQAKQYMNLLKNIDKNIVWLFCVSYSKTLSFYGMRLGAVVIYNKNQTLVDDIYNSFKTRCRSLWGSVNHGAIESLVKLYNKNFDSYLQEKQKYIDLLEKRFKTFNYHANRVGLEVFPNDNQGFFLTIPGYIKNNKLLHQKLMDNNIFTVLYKQGIRIAICSLNINECENLPVKIKAIIDEVKRNENK